MNISTKKAIEQYSKLIKYDEQFIPETELQIENPILPPNTPKSYIYFPLAEYYIYRGDLFYKLGNSISAIADYEKALSYLSIYKDSYKDLQSRCYQVVDRIASNYSKLGEFQRAIRKYDLITENDSTSSLLDHIYTKKAVLKRKLGDVQGAIHDEAKAQNLKNE